MAYSGGSYRKKDIYTAKSRIKVKKKKEKTVRFKGKIIFAVLAIVWLSLSTDFIKMLTADEKTQDIIAIGFFAVSIPLGHILMGRKKRNNKQKR